MPDPNQPRPEADAPSPPAPSPPAAARRGRGALSLLLWLLLLVVIIATAWYFLGRGEEHAPPPAPVLHQTLYINIKNPDDHQALMSLKQACKDHPGTIEVILVLGEEKKSAIRLPFKVEDSAALLGKLVKSLGEDAVVMK